MKMNDKLIYTKGVEISEVEFNFSQDVDSCQDSDDMCQVLKVFTQDAGGGSYICIKTDRWAIDTEDIDKFAEILKKIVGMAR
jgi:hypothetical protein